MSGKDKKGFSGIISLSSDLSEFKTFDRNISDLHPKGEDTQLSQNERKKDLLNNKEEFQEISKIAHRALELEKQAEIARIEKDIGKAKIIYEELINKIIPASKELCMMARNKCFAYFTHGLVLRVAGMRQEAVNMYKLSLDISPNVINTLLEMTRCLGELHRTQEALSYAKRAVNVEPESAAAWGNLAMSLIQTKDKRNAYKAIEKAVGLDPGDLKNHYILNHFDLYFD